MFKKLLEHIESIFNRTRSDFRLRAIAGPSNAHSARLGKRIRKIKACGTDKPLARELYFQRRYRCRDSIRPLRTGFYTMVTVVCLARGQIFDAAQRKFRCFLSSGSSITISREESLVRQYRWISPRRLISAFFFISPRTTDTGLIIGNTGTRLITRDRHPGLVEIRDTRIIQVRVHLVRLQILFISSRFVQISEWGFDKMNRYNDLRP